MELGVFARTFPRNTLEAILDAARGQGFDSVHFSFRALGEETLPANLDPGLCEQVADAFRVRSLCMVGLSATYNMIHPDRTYRAEQTRLASLMIQAAGLLGTNLVTLCTGTRDARDMWRRHPANDSEAAWVEMRMELEKLARVAECAGVVLGVEPEPGNTVSTAIRARRLLDEIGAAPVGIVLDPANLVADKEEAEAARLLDEAFDLLADRVVVVHAKRVFDPAAKVDWMRVGRLIDRYQMRAPVVIHDVPENELEQARDFLQRILEPAAVSQAFEHDGITFRYRAEGDGDAVILLHGLGGDRWQALDLVPASIGTRVALDLRSHGDTHPVGDLDAFTFSTFSKDLHAFLDALSLERVILVGVSMGAGVALRFALDHADRVRAMVLVRPAWIERPLTSNLAPFVQIGRLLYQLGPELGKRSFQESPQFRAIAAASTYAATSLSAQFTKPHAVVRAPRLERMPASTPFSRIGDLQALDVPALVLGARQDPLHPIAYAMRWARALPTAELRTIASNDISKPEHDQDVRHAAGRFLIDLRNGRS